MSVNIRDHLNNSPLHTAVLKNRAAIVKGLLRYGADVDATDFQGKTPLHLAVTSHEILLLLLRNQPKLSIQDNQGNTFLHSMIRIKDWWKRQQPRPAYMDSVSVTVKSILSFRPDINITNRSGESPFHRILLDIPSPREFYMEVILEFLNCKPDVTTPLRSGSSPLAVFLENSDLLSKDGPKYPDLDERVGFQCLEQFLVAGADPNTIFHSMPLPLFWLKNGHFKEKIRPGQLFFIFLKRRISMLLTLAEIIPCTWF
jgi:ankyrin repeat protein